jgi:hypothetical protein
MLTAHEQLRLPSFLAAEPPASIVTGGDTFDATAYLAWPMDGPSAGLTSPCRQALR